MGAAPSTAQDRALGALMGLAVGDALGMPTQLLDRATIARRHGPVLAGFAPGPDDHPIAAGMPAGSVTDDTEQALVLARVLLDGHGHVDPHVLAHELVAWEDRMRARGSLDLLGPSTRRALSDLLAGVPVELTGLRGDTNGAAMRIAPVGVAVPPDVDAVVAAVVEASRVTHHTSVALAGAAAVAAAVSAGVAGAGAADTLDLALASARLAAGQGRWVAGADVAARIAWAIALVEGLDDTALLDTVGTLVGTSLATQESVPAAFAIVAARPDDPWLAVRLAASVGGDCDTIAAMAGAMIGARHGAGAFPEAVRRQVEAVNHLPLDSLVPGLLALRDHDRDRDRDADPDHDADARGGRTTTAPGPNPGQPADRSRPGPAPTPAPSSAPANLATLPRARVVHVGQAVVDLVIRVPRLPTLGGDVLAGPVATAAGGGTNTLLAAARQGVRVLHVGSHGTGPHGDLVRAALVAEGVELAQPPLPDQDTGTVVVLVDATGERTFVTSPGAEAHLAPHALAGVRPEPADVVCVSGYALAHLDNRAALLSWLPTLPDAATVLFDPGPLIGEVPREVVAQVLDRADWCTATAEEATLLTGETDPRRAVVALARRTRARRARPGTDGPDVPGSAAGGRAPSESRGGSAVVRLGAHGCLVGTPDGAVVTVPAMPVDPVDLTGAGDAHTGVLAAGLAAGLAAPDAVRRATVAASLSVTEPGPATCPTADRIDRALAEAPSPY